MYTGTYTDLKVVCESNIIVSTPEQKYIMDEIILGNTIFIAIIFV